LFETPTTSADERFDRLKAAIDRWYGPAAGPAGFADAELDAAEARLSARLSTSLRRWYRMAGRRHEVWSLQDRFVPPDCLTADGEYLPFYWENQFNFYWGVRTSDLSCADPPVWRLLHGPPRQAAPTVSEFACMAFLYNLVFFDLPTGFFGVVTDAALRFIEASFRECALPRIAIFDHEVTLYEAYAAVLHLWRRSDGTPESVSFACRSAERYRQIRSALIARGVNFSDGHAPEI
jgi:hypothetical protein